MESTFLNMLWRQRKEQKEKRARCWTPYLGSACTGASGETNDKAAVSVFPRDHSLSCCWVKRYHFLLPLTNSQGKLIRWNICGVLFHSVPRCETACMLAYLFRSALDNGWCVKVIEWLLALALDSSLSTELHRYDTPSVFCISNYVVLKLLFRCLSCGSSFLYALRALSVDFQLRLWGSFWGLEGCCLVARLSNSELSSSRFSSEWHLIMCHVVTQLTRSG